MPVPRLSLQNNKRVDFMKFKNMAVCDLRGYNSVEAASEIESISGATITSKAIANGCNAALVYFRDQLGGAQ